MARSAYSRIDYEGAAVATTISSGINASDTSAFITVATGWPDCSNGSFFAVIAEGTAAEEKIEVTTRSSLTLTIVRGKDGTTGATHASGVAIRPCFTAIEADEANLTVSKTVGKATAAGQILVVDAANSFAAVQAKTSGQILVGNGTTLVSVAMSGDATIASSGALTVGNLAITTAKINDLGVTTGKINDLAVTNGKLAGMTRGTVKIGNSSGAASDLAIGSAGKFLKTDGTDATWQSLPNSRLIASRAASLNVAVSTLVAIPWDTETADTDNYLTPTSSTVTIPATGDYMILLYADWGSSYTNRLLRIVADGVTWNHRAFGTDLDEVFPLGPVALTASSTVVCSAFQTSASPGTITGKIMIRRFTE